MDCDLVGEYRCTKMDNAVEYCRHLHINSLLLKLIPAAPMPYMTLSRDSESCEYTFHGTMKVGPFQFDDIYKFRTDGTGFYLRLTPSLYGIAQVRCKDSTLVFDVQSITDGSQDNLTESED